MLFTILSRTDFGIGRPSGWNMAQQHKLIVCSSYNFTLEKDSYIYIEARSIFIRETNDIIKPHRYCGSGSLGPPILISHEDILHVETKFCYFNPKKKLLDCPNLLRTSNNTVRSISFQEFSSHCELIALQIRL